MIQSDCASEIDANGENVICEMRIIVFLSHSETLVTT